MDPNTHKLTVTRNSSPLNFSALGHRTARRRSQICCILIKFLKKKTRKNSNEKMKAGGSQGAEREDSQGAEREDSQDLTFK